MTHRLDTTQLVVVTTVDWQSTTGQLHAYNREGERWVQAIGPVHVTFGRNGMAWGKGLHDPQLNQPPLKTEGDGKSPAGIFTLDSLYGYGGLPAKMDYLKVDENTFCVDDPDSAHYNRIVHGSEVQKDWKSAETMRMKSDAYKYGIVVGYNRQSVVPGAGSCIFIHLGRPDGTTAGCTAMAEDDMLKLIGFLDKAKNPLLVQMPEAEYHKLAKTHLLPTRNK